jgi:hypothetical protein
MLKGVVRFDRRIPRSLVSMLKVNSRQLVKALLRAALALRSGVAMRR